MKIKFPDWFVFGTSTSACQVETPFEHDWLNTKARDGQMFSVTTDHEKRLMQDVDVIASLAPHYRMSLMWSKLQRAPYAQLDRNTVAMYSDFLRELNDRGVKIMMVMHHFANPTWFASNGGWANKENIEAWLNYGKQLVEIFCPFVESWNTFNEPNLYTAMAYVAGEFPPFKRNLLQADRVIRNIATAHDLMYDFIKEQAPNKMVGISHNCAIFKGDTLLGKIPAKMFDWAYMTYAEEVFAKGDFFGLSYYARIGFDPYPVTWLSSPERIEMAGKAHDDMWEYYPAGLEECIMRFWKKYRKPVIITENGICTKDDTKRNAAIRDYMRSMWQAMEKGADVRGYYHWSTWDNFEWSLGPSYQFGLYSCDPRTKDRRKKPSADLYSKLAFWKEINLE